jgi:hypothetical protein
MIQTLVNGCSHIAGTELDANLDLANKLTWPNLNKNWKTVNIAKAGASNDAITRTTIDYLENNSVDFVCIQWTIFERIEVQIPFYKEHQVYEPWFSLHSRDAELDQNINCNGKFMKELARNIFLKQFDTDWFFNYNMYSILAMQQYLVSNQLDYIFVFTNWPQKRTDPRFRLLNKEKVFDQSWYNFCRSGHYKELDGAHYELKAHQDFYQLIEGHL